MPNLHDIEKRIKSVESSTKQITHTMEMVAGAKIVIRPSVSKLLRLMARP